MMGRHLIAARFGPSFYRARRHRDMMPPSVRGTPAVRNTFIFVVFLLMVYIGITAMVKLSGASSEKQGIHHNGKINGNSTSTTHQNPVSTKNGSVNEIPIKVNDKKTPRDQPSRTSLTMAILFKVVRTDIGMSLNEPKDSVQASGELEKYSPINQTEPEAPVKVCNDLKNDTEIKEHYIEEKTDNPEI